MSKMTYGWARIAIGMALVGATLSLSPTIPAAVAAGPCDPGSSPIVCENSKPGTPSSIWDINNNGDPSIQGFATDMSVDVGETVGFKVDTDATAYSLLIYRMGWYGGDGARLVDTIAPSATLPQTQPACLTDSATNLLDCGNWGLSASWTVPADAVSGVYIARLVRDDTGGDSHIVFVVRDDARSSDVLFQTSDTTWQAYNDYGGTSTYFGPQGRAYKVSYNRPMSTRGGTPDGRDSFFGSEYAMLRWMERNGYDVSYQSGIDTDRLGSSHLLNHDVFLSVGHDEYWSGQQRAHVEAARDAGVNLIFASGNEVYWKTRWEPSIDASNTDYRTMVVYKETLDAAKIDPSSEWTGTWRDPRFSPPSDGGRPENELTGTFFTVNCCTYSLKVPAEYGNLRFWRNTSVASLATGTEKVFPFGTLGYEWDEDLDNGFRPAGVFRMSSTTELVPQRLIDYGQTVAEEEATHHLMMYRAPSGALVFGAGTVQWSWGLDTYHDGTPAPVDPDMQQATVNVLADMGVQPDTLEAGLVAATASTDATAPSVSVVSPSSGQAFTHGDVVSVSGTATDAGGGVVAAIEVSTDGGSSWHPADGRDSWTYTAAANTQGSQTIMVRASDDSGNLGNSSSVSISVDCPCQIFSDGAVPEVESFNDTSQIELGVKFQADIDGWVTGVRFYKGPLNTGTHVGSLWDAAGTLLAQGTFTNETATGWQDLTFAEPVFVTANTTYVGSYHAPDGGYAGDTEWFAAGPTMSPPLRALQDTANDANGVYSVSSSPTFPTSTFGASNYWVDVVFSDVALPDTRPPGVVGTAPLAGSSSVAVDSNVSVIFDEPIDPATISFNLADASANPVAGSVSYDAPSLTVTFDPTAELSYATVYDAVVTASDVAGNAMSAALQFSFESGLADGAVAALWDDSVVPGTVDSGDPGSIEVGVKFAADTDLTISGVRFYKSLANTGTHVGSLWDASGALLASVTFSGESTAGWQEALFSAPVAISAGTTYVVSYLAPNGHYSADGGYFGAAYSNGPLTAPASAAVGGNGVYSYGSGGFPSSSYNDGNYWVTPVYEVPPDVAGPVLVSSTPIDGASSVAVDTAIAAVFDEPVEASSVVMTVADGGNSVTGSASYDPASLSVTFVPSGPLAAGTTYVGSVSATDLLGNATATPLTFSFTTALAPGSVAALWDDSVVPGTVDSGDPGSVELGVKFTASEDLNVTGVRFYKSVANTGTHVGSLWDASGTLLASVTFSGESAAGWQEASFSAPVVISSGQTYVVSYFAPNGHYSVTGGYFSASYSNGPLTAPASFAVGGNGVYSYGSGGFPSSSYNNGNYWVSPVYEVLPDVSSPVLVSSTPVDGASSVAVDTAIAAVFDEPVEASSVVISVAESGGTPVAGLGLYDAGSLTVSFTPSAALAAETSYVVSVSATDLLGNAMALPATFSFTSAAGAAGAALWDDTAVPGTVDSGDPGSVELGVKFTASEDLNVTGVRFYKSAANTGTHVGSLWDASGTLLASVTFSGESTAGWQEASFSAPVAITAGTTYVVSYLAPDGHYSVTGGYFSASYSNGPLTAPASFAVGGNGVYSYGSGGFPSSSYNNGNYWVTPVYEAP